MTISVLTHGANGRGAGAATTLVVTLSGTPTNGNTLFAHVGCHLDITNKHIVIPAGWTLRDHADSDGWCWKAATKVAASEGTTVTFTFEDYTGAVASAVCDATVVEVSGAYGGIASMQNASHGNPHIFAALTPGSGFEALMVAMTANADPYNVTVYPSVYTLIDEFGAGGDARVMSLSLYEAITTSGAYNDSYSMAGGATDSTVQAYFTALPVIGIDFEGDPLTGDAPLLVTFDSTATGGTPSAYAWDFGDGGTSTSADPTHTYTEPGTYTVSLTATIGGTDYTETKVSYVAVLTNVGFEDPPPAGVLIEIYTNEAGSARWDEATWDDDVWSIAGWQDITPESVKVTITWGSSQPELGILSQPDASSWAVSLYDPDRVLDPGNASSPYFGDLEPGLPVRASHRGTVIRRGKAESIGHDFTILTEEDGYIRVTDVQSTLANATVAHDTSLPNTLFARARAAISAAGVACEVLADPPAGDPALVAWADSGDDRSAWAWIADAAQQVLWVPYIDRLERLGFREYANPLIRGREVTDREMIGLLSVVQFNGNYSRVDVEDGAGVLSESRAIVPPPRYGVRTFVRADPTPDDGAWAQTVLDDRALTSLRWIPGQVFPLTARAAEDFATVEAVEVIRILDASTDPVVDVDAIVVGGQIDITAKRGEEAQWWFTYQTTQTVTLPLLVSGSDPPEYLYSSLHDEYLYPSR